MNLSRDQVYVEHMLETLNRIDKYVVGGRDVFMSSELVQDAVVRNLQVMTESSQRLSGELKQRHSEIDWRGMAGFRNILTHDYLGLDLELIWETINKELPGLKKSLQNES